MGCGVWGFGEVGFWGSGVLGKWGVGCGVLGKWGFGEVGCGEKINEFWPVAAFCLLPFLTKKLILHDYLLNVITSPNYWERL